MKIGIVTNTSWNIFNFRKPLILKFIELGFEVVAIAPEDEHSAKLSDMGCVYVPVEINNTGSTPLADFRLYRKLIKVYKTMKLDIVLHFTIKPNIYGTLAARSLNIPMINNVSGLGTVFLNRGLTSAIAKWLYKYSFKKAAVTFFQNEDDRRDFIGHLGLKNLKYDLLPGSGINLDDFKPVALPNNKNFTFLMIARLILDKGVLEYFQAAKDFDKTDAPVRFNLVGQLDENHSRGVSKIQLDRLISDGAINYLGTSSCIQQEISKADCVVLPSYREGTPRTLLEAAAMAKPLIATDVPGCREVVRHGHNGLLCKPQDSKSLCQSMRKIYSFTKGKRAEMGQNGRQLMEQRFNEKLVVEIYLKYIYQYSNAQQVILT